MGTAVDWMDWARTLFALLVTLSLIGAVAYGARKLGMLRAPGAQAPRRIEVAESLMLDPRRRLVIVRCGKREHLLLLSATGDQVIAALEPEEEERS